MTIEATTAPVEGEKRRGRPVGSRGKISRLRRLLTQLEGMAKTQAPAVIQSSLDGKSPDKEQLATAKWIVSTVVTIHKACLAEEEMKNAAEDAELADEVATEERAVFSLKRAV